MVLYTGLGLPGSKLNEITGIFKAYTTRVGGGPFPTELFDEDGQTLGHVKEFGATTVDLGMLLVWITVTKYSAGVNGLT